MHKRGRALVFFGAGGIFFPHFCRNKKEQKDCEHREQDVFVAGVPACDNRPVVLQEIAETAQKCIPEKDSDEGVREIGAKRQAQRPRDKAEVCAAERDEAPEKDNLCAFFLEICIGSFKSVPGFWEAPHNALKQRVAAKTANTVAQGGAD